MAHDRLPINTHYEIGLNATRVGALAYGCWRMAGTSTTAAAEKINTALDHGMTLIDTADIYGSRWPEGFGEAEALLGEVLAEDGGLRGRMVLASKGGIVPGQPYDSSADYLVSACEASLTRLKTDVIDLYQIHRPDFLAHPAEVACALTKLRDAGKIIDVGVSNYSPAQFSALQAHLDFKIACHQPEFSICCTDPIEDGVLDQCMETGAAALAWSPLAGGALLGTAPSKEPRLIAIQAVLDRLGATYETDRASVALAFLLAHPAKVIPIIGTQTPARIAEAVKAFDVPLTRRDWYDLLEARRGTPMP